MRSKKSARSSRSGIGSDRSAPRKVALASSRGSAALFCELLEGRRYMAAGVLREYWDSVTGAAVANLTADARYPSAPTSSVLLPAFEATTNAGDNYGQRLRAYVTPTASGAYTFYVAGDDAAQLYLSADADPTHKSLVASTAAWTNSREWTKYASQQSTPVQLQAGQRYYIEAVHKEGTGGDSLAVGWSGPGIGSPAVIAGSYLTAYAPPIVPAGPTLAASWAFDETTGTTAADAGAGSRTLTLVGGASFTAGRSGNALTLNGTSGYAKTAASSPALDTAASYTVSAWINWSGATGNRAIVSTEGTNRSAFNLQLRNGQPVMAANTTDLAGSGASSAILYSWGALPANTWHHVAGVYDAAAGQMRIYVDGVRQGSLAFAGGFHANGATTVGAAWFNGARSDYFAGQIDDARAYASALTDAQAQQQYAGILPAQAGAPGAPADLAAQPATGSPAVLLAWSADSTEASFVVQRSADGGTTWATAGTAVPGARTYTNTGLTAGTAYIYRVLATDAGGTSGPSPAVVVTTLPAAGVAGLAAHWTFDEASGSAGSLDRTGNGNALAFAGGASLTAGRAGGGNALTLNGTGGFAKTASSPVVDSSASYTLSAWISWNGGSGNRAIISEDGTNRSAFSLQLRNGQPVLAVNATDAAGTAASSVIIYGWAVLPAGTWHHVAGVYDATAGQVILYVDGVRQASAAFAGSFHANGPTVVGAGLFNGARADYFGGQIDDARAYAGALSQSQVKDVGGILLAVQALGGNGARLTWENPSPSAAGFKILQSSDGETFTQVATAAANAESALVEGLGTSTIYYFKVVAVDAGGTTLSTIGPVAVTTGATDTAGYYTVSVVPGDATNGVIPKHQALTANTGVGSAGLTIVGGSGVVVYASDWAAAVYKVMSGTVSMGGQAYAFATSRRFRVATASRIADGSTGVGLDTAGYGLTAGDQVVGFEDSLDNDFNDYYFRVKAMAAEIPPGSSVQTNIKFAPDGYSAVPGYSVDFGVAYGPHSNGRTFGWVDAATGVAASNLAAFERGGEDGKRVNGGIVTTGKTWEIEVPNGTYFVKLVAGDGNVTSGSYAYGVENVSNFLSGTAGAGTARWVSATGTVVVSDGKLTIRNGSGAANHALTYVEITDYAAINRSTVSAPADVIATAAGDNVTDVRWTDRSDNELGFKVERATNPNGPWTMLGEKPEHPDLSTYSNAGLYVDDSGAAGVTYYYRLTAVKNGAVSASAQSNALTAPNNVHGRTLYNPSRRNWTTGETIQAEDYDVSGSGTAYYDTSGGNGGGYYRSGNGDLGFNVQNGRYFVGWERVGEWQEYTINVPQSGVYRLEVSAASAAQGGKINMSIGGTVKVVGLQVPTTASVADYQTVQSDYISLHAGTGQVVRITAAKANQNGVWSGDLDWIRLVPVSTGRGVSIVASPAEVEEDSSTPITFTVILNEAQFYNQSLTIPLQSYGDLSFGDYLGSIPSSVQFARPTGGFVAGALYTKSFVLTPVEDSIAEDDETISVAIRPLNTVNNGVYVAESGVANASNAVASATILASDGAETGPGDEPGGNDANPLPTIVAPASIDSVSSDGTTVDLTVAADDDGGQANLTYTWSVTDAPDNAQAPSFAANGTNDADPVTATFSKAGTYVVNVQVSDADGNVVDGGSVEVVVGQVFTSASIVPISLSLAAGASYPFSVVAYDQFGDEMVDQPNWIWSVDPSPSGGTITQGGRYTAPSSMQPVAATVRATSGSLSAVASVTIGSTISAPSSVSATGADDSTALHVTWVDQASTETSYLVSVFTKNRQLVTSQTVPADSTEAVVGGLTEGTPYWVVVAAMADGLPPASAQAPALAYTRLAKPTDQAAGRTNNGIHVTWGDASKHETGYSITATAMVNFVDATGSPVAAGTILEQQTVAASAAGASGGAMACDLTTVPIGKDVLIEIVAIAAVAGQSSMPASVSLTNDGGPTAGDPDPWQSVLGKKNGFELSIGSNQNSSVDITGVPIPEPSPTGEGEDDRKPSLSRVEMYGLTSSFSATDVAVPMPGGDLLLEVRRNQSIANILEKNGPAWGNLTNGYGDGLANFKWDSENIFGTTWSSNLAIRAVQSTGSSHDSSDPAYRVTVVDESGASLTYASSDRQTWHPYVKSSLDNDAFKATLRTEGTGFVLRKAFGTELHFEAFVDNSVQRDVTDGVSVETYYRIKRIVDRNSNEIDYAYDYAGHSTLPTAIYDPTTADRRITLDYGDFGSSAALPKIRLKKVTDPLGHETEYHYSDNGAGYLTDVLKPAVVNAVTGATVRPTTHFTYATSDYNGLLLRNRDLWAVGLGHGLNFGYEYQTGWVAPGTITDPNGDVTTFHYTEEYMPSSIRATTNLNTNDNLEFWDWKPRLTSINTAAGTAYFDTVGDRQLLNVTTKVTDVRGVTTYYTYDLDKVQANNELGYGLVVHELDRVTDANSSESIDASDPIVKYTYGNGLLSDLEKVVDVSGNVVQFVYDSNDANDAYNKAIYNVGGTLYNRYALFEKPAMSVLDGDAGHLNLTTQYRYETTFNKLIRQVDPSGTATVYTVNPLNGNRTVMIEGEGSPIAATSRYSYDSHGFMIESKDADGRVTDFVPNAYGQTEYMIVKGIAGEDLTPLDGTSFYSGTDPNGPSVAIDAGAKWIVTRSVSDVMGRVTASYDPTGDVTTYGYDDLNRQTSVTSPAVPNGANVADRLTPVTSTAYTGYDRNGNVVKTTDDNGNVTTTTYDAFNRPLVTRRRMTNPNVDDDGADIITSVAYDQAGLVKSETDAEGHTTDYDYDALQRRTKTTLPTVTLPGGGTTRYETTYEYGPNSGSGAFTLGGFNPTRVINARGYATDTVYDGAYRAVRTVRRHFTGSSLDYLATTAAPSAGEPSTSTQYDAAGKPYLSTTLNETRDGDAANRSTYTYYDARHRVVATAVDMDGDGTGVAAGTTLNSAVGQPWDADDLVSQSKYDAAGHVKVATDAEGRSTTTIYDGAGRVKEVDLPKVTVFEAPNSTSVGVTPIARTQYDADGHAAVVIDARGTKTQSTFDARGRTVMTILDLDGNGTFDQSLSGGDIVTRTGYDLGGRTVYSIDPRGNETDTEYDHADRVHIITGAFFADAENGGAMTRPTTVTEYDRDGKVRTVTDPRGIVTTTDYDELGRGRTVTANSGAAVGSADRLVTESRYDANGNVVALVLHNLANGQPQDQVTTYVFDAYDRQTSQTLPAIDTLTRTTTTAYDRAGDAILTTDPMGKTVESDYDRAGRVVEQRFDDHVTGGPNGSLAADETRTSHYDRVGNLLSRTDAHGVTTYGYDALNRQTSEHRVSGSIGSGTTGVGGDDYTVTSYFDLAGNRTKVVYPSTGRTLISTYDRAGRMKTLKDGGKTTSFDYDHAGNRTSEVAANGQVTTSVFDPANRVTSFTTVGAASGATPGPAVYLVTYDYDRAGQRRTSHESFAAGFATRDLTWSYDGLYRLTGESWTGASAQARSYTYDPAGNRLTRTVTLDGGTPQVTTSHYDALNELKSTLQVQNGGPTVSTSYTYDVDGNRLTKSSGGDLTTYYYDASNRLIEADDSGGTGQIVFRAAYDARSRRIAKTENDVTTRYRYDGGTNFQEVDKDGFVKTELVRAGGMGGGIGSVLYSDTRTAPATTGGAATTKTEYFAYNAVGSTVALTDGGGTPTQRTMYEAFGEVVITDGTSTNNRLRNTKERDASIGLDNDGMRYYDPATGVYVQRDPIGYGDGLNVYASVHANPVNGVDPLGLHEPDADRMPSSYDIERARWTPAPTVEGSANFVARLHEETALGQLSASGYDPKAGSIWTEDLKEYTRQATTDVEAAAMNAGYPKVAIAAGALGGFVHAGVDMGTDPVVLGTALVAPATRGIGALAKLGEGAEAVASSNALGESSAIRSGMTSAGAPESSAITKSIGELRSAGLKDAHHVIQDAAVRDLPGYNTNAAPGVQLPGPSTAVGTPHYNATQVQRLAGGGTYGAEAQIGYDALRSAGMNHSDASQAIREANTYFDGLGVTESTPTRIPGNRPR